MMLKKCAILNQLGVTCENRGEPKAEHMRGGGHHVIPALNKKCHVVFRPISVISMEVSL